MSDKGRTTGGRNTHAIILSVIGIILAMAGVLIATVHCTGLRGSGLGTAAIAAGVVPPIIACLRFSRKPA